MHSEHGALAIIVAYSQMPPGVERGNGNTKERYWGGRRGHPQYPPSMILLFPDLAPSEITHDCSFLWAGFLKPLPLPAILQSGFPPHRILPESISESLPKANQHSRRLPTEPIQ